jgi:hypothetical protein
MHIILNKPEWQTAHGAQHIAGSLLPLLQAMGLSPVVVEEPEGVVVNPDDLIEVLRAVTQGNIMEYLVVENGKIEREERTALRSLMEAWVKHNAEKGVS